MTDAKYPEYGAAWERHRDEVREKRLTCIARFLAYLPTESTRVVLDKRKPGVLASVLKVSLRGAELAEIIFLCISTIGREKDIREIGSHVCIQFILKALNLCMDDTTPTVNGLRTLYNFCFRNQLGHENIRSYVSPEHVTVRTTMEKIRGGSAFSEFEVRREYRRLQLALEDDGWRGNVEEAMHYPTDWEHAL